MKIGLTLPNRGVLLGATTPAQLLEMAQIADESTEFHSVWVGDSLLGKPRLESLTLLAAIAARTKRVRIGTACMASFPLRDPILLAYQWASLDLLAQGRTVLVACTGIVEQAGAAVESKLYGVQNRDRVRRLTEWIEILKLLWTEDDVSFNGEYYQFSGVTIEPKPAAKPRPPIWIANNPGRRNLQTSVRPDAEKALIERTHRRVVEHADGWQTSICDVEDLAWRLDDIRAKTREAGRKASEIETHLVHSININDDRDEALDESKRYLDMYYGMDYGRDFLRCWTASGTPDDCVTHLKRFRDLGFDEVTLRITSWNQLGQLERLIREVLPRLVD